MTRARHRRAVCLGGLLASASVLLALAAAPAARGGFYTVEIGCQAGSALNQPRTNGWYFSGSPLFDQAIDCATPWSPLAVPAHAGLSLAVHPGALASPDAQAAWTFVAPGDTLYKRRLSGFPAPPDLPFSDQADIAGVTVSQLFTRAGNSAYTVGLFTNALAGFNRHSQRVRGCLDGSSSGADQPGVPPSSCDPAAPGPSYYSAGETISLPPGVHELSWLVQCGTAGPCPTASPADASLALSNLAVTVSESRGPEQAVQGGGLSSGASAVAGNQSLTFDVRDLVGVDRVELFVDGRPGAVASRDYPGCGPAQGAVITTLVPCPADGDRVRTDTIVVDTTTLSNGHHLGDLRGTDALGNTSDSLFSFTVDNRDNGDVETRLGTRASTVGAPTQIGAPALRGACRRRARRCRARPAGRLSVRNSLLVRRWTTPVFSAPGGQTVRGVLAGVHGRPIAGAPVAVFTQHGQTAAFDLSGWVRSDRAGEFAWTRPGAGRTVKFLYLGDATHRGAVGEARVRVAVRTTLSIDERRRFTGEPIVVTGGVLNRPVPAGMQVGLQFRAGTRWPDYAVVTDTSRVDAHGRWRWCQLAPAVPRHGVRLFYVRARILRQRGFPYESGYSPVRRFEVSLPAHPRHGACPGPGN